jgi:hypothetical protein
MGARLETLNLRSGSPCGGNGYHGYGHNNLVPKLGRERPMKALKSLLLCFRVHTCRYAHRAHGRG